MLTQMNRLQGFDAVAPTATPSQGQQALRLFSDSHIEQFDSVRWGSHQSRSGSSNVAAFSGGRQFGGNYGSNTRFSGSNSSQSIDTLNSGLSIGALAPSAGVGVTTTDFVGNNRGTAYNIGDLNNFNFNWNDSVSTSDADDFFRVRMTNAGVANFSLSGMSADADLYLYNSSGGLITYSNAGGASNESISRFLAAGTYYLQVHSFAGSTTNYHLNTNGAGPATDPGSSRFSAHDLGNINRSSRGWNDYVGSGDASDWHHFELTESTNWHLSLTGLSADADVALYNSNGAFITSSTAGGSANESINRFLTAGDYYVQVYQYSGSTNYSLGMSAGYSLVLRHSYRVWNAGRR
ncbi:PPC domain-containing protein [Kovacikia minuta CCNUW1]|uniref:PPC domain-containing protein n=1 Tax=Kovacikia minuta TaxID=2931930 RepID=UPI001CC9C24D|nr:PPC domain-containing protein [Kovacikia minuta]UBF23799.1 PPC domain-containing protein [Kovacikia minuta CCNUW1]